MKNSKWWMGLTAAACLAAGTAVGQTYTEKVDGLTWTYSVKEGKATVEASGGSHRPTIPASTQGRVSIPPTLGGCPVTGIGTYAFYGCTSLTEVVVADGVTNIADYAFARCTALTNMAIPSSVTDIGVNVFQQAPAAIHDTSSIAGVDLVDGWAVGWNGEIAAEPDLSGVHGIAGGAFSSCPNLVRVALPETVAGIGSSAFNACSNLVSATIPDKVFCIGSNAFAHCVRLASVSLGRRVERIGPSAFLSCASLPEVDFPDTLVEIGHGAFAGCTGLADVSIPGSVRDIRYDAFDGCTQLADVSLASGVTNIEQSAFGNCNSLKTIAFPDSAKQIDHAVCMGCSNLRWMYLPGDVEETVDHYRECMYRPSDLPAGATAHHCAVVFGSMRTLGNWQYSVNSKGEATVWNGMPDDYGVLTIPFWLGGDRVVQIGTCAFAGRSDLTRVVVPEGVEWIANYAFNGCDNLLGVSLPDSLKGIEDCAFSYCPSLQRDRVTVPGLALLDGWVLEAPTDWTGELDLSRVRGIRERALWSCREVASVVVGDKVKGIGRDTFYGCTGLESVVLPDSVEFIGHCSFRGCTNLQSVAIGSGVKLFRCGPGWGGGTWGGTPDIHIHDLAAWCNTDFCGEPPLKGCRLFLDGEVAGKLAIPAGVARISDHAFEGSRGVEAVTIPESVVSIGSATFSNCANLVSATILGNVTNTYEEWDMPPFVNCPNLATMVLGGKMETIGPWMFSRCPGLANVTIGDSVKAIGGFAFYGCSNLVSVAIGGSVTNIAKDAFGQCPALSSVAIPDSVAGIGEWAFYGCSGLRALKIGSGVERIEPYAFYGCTNLAKVDLHDVGAWCVIDCDGDLLSSAFSLFVDGMEATALAIPEGTPEIRPSAFRGCTNVVSVAVPASVTNIGNRAFSGCSGLREVHVRDLAAWCGIDFGTGDGNPLLQAHRLFLDGTEVAELSIPTGVREIRPYAFNSCSSLVSVDLPGSLVDVGNSAFYACSNLARLAIADGVENVGPSAFGRCVRLGSVSLPASVRGLEFGAFGYCSRLTNVTVEGTLTNDWSRYSNPFYRSSALATVTVGDKATRIGASMFAGCTGLTALVVSGNVTNDWDSYGSPFEDCPHLETVMLAGNMTRVGSNMFGWCTGPMHVTLGEKVESVDTKAFPTSNSKPCEIRSVTILGNVTNGGFSNQDYLERVVLSGKLEEIGEYMFGGCPRLAEVEIGDGVAAIGARAFAWDTALESLAIPASVRSIGPQAFYGSGLRHLELPGSVTSVGEQAFAGCTGLEELLVPAAWKGTDMLAAADVPEGCRIVYGGSEPEPVWSYTVENGEATVTGVEPAEGELAVPETLGGCPVTAVGSGAFRGCTGLESLVLPEGVTNIGEYAFAYGEGLTLAIPESVKGVALTAFEGSRNLTVVAGNNVLGEGEWGEERWGENYWHFNARLFNSCTGFSLVVSTNVARIGEYTFGECAALTSLTIPDSVTEIGQDAFGNCSGLAELVLPGSVVRIGSQDNYGTYGAFRDCTGLTELVLPNGLREIGPYTFAGCSNVTNLFLPNTLVAVGADEYGGGGYAFQGCGANGLAVAIEAGTTQIWASAFSGSGLVSLDQVSIPASVKGIGNRAFYGCDALASAVVPEGVESIGDNAFGWCGALTDLVLPDSLREIGAGAFSGCTGLAGVEIPDGVTVIGSSAFSGCAGLTSVELPAALAALEGYVFTGCTGLVSVALPVGLETLDTYAFSGCTGLERIDVADRNAAFSSRDGVLFSGDGKQLVLYPPARTAAVYVIPDGVAAIGERAFNDCTHLVEIEMPASVVDMGIGEWSNPFDGCTALEAVVVAEGNPAYRSEDGVLFGKPGEGSDVVLLLHPSAKGGRAYAIPEGTTRIGPSAFSGCTGLEEVEIPEGVTHIGAYAFQGTGLAAVSTPGSLLRIGDHAFAACTNLASATIAAGQVGHGTLVWEPDYEDYVFDYCEALEAVTLGPGVTEVAPYAFSWSGVRTLYVPSAWEGVTNSPVAHVFYDDGGRWPQEHQLEIVYCDAPVEPATQTTPVPVPLAWLEEEAAGILAACGGDHEAAANAKAANGRPVWECYVAGLSTKDAEAEFKVKSISLADGEVKIEWDPDLNDNGTKAERRYVVEGKQSMDGEWGDKTPDSRFFRVKVVLLP